MREYTKWMQRVFEPTIYQGRLLLNPGARIRSAVGMEFRYRNIMHLPVAAVSFVTTTANSYPLLLRSLYNITPPVD